MTDNPNQRSNPYRQDSDAGSCQFRRGNEADISLGIRVMREEMKAFLFDPKYADERELTLGTGSGLAMVSLTAECIRRILAERN